MISVWAITAMNDCHFCIFFYHISLNPQFITILFKKDSVWFNIEKNNLNRHEFAICCSIVMHKSIHAWIRHWPSKSYNLYSFFFICLRVGLELQQGEWDHHECVRPRRSAFCQTDKRSTQRQKMGKEHWRGRVHSNQPVKSHLRWRERFVLGTRAAPRWSALSLRATSWLPHWEWVSELVRAHFERTQAQALARSSFGVITSNPTDHKVTTYIYIYI